ncbi:MAG: DUF115 domain-containing protein [Chlamydiia bacterium]|nr:DUF115 domain-containing protein [Chlamydiia bacterium]
MNNLDALEQKSPLFALELRTENRREVPLKDFPLPKEETLALYLYALGPLPWQEKILKWLEENPQRRIYLIPEDPQILHHLSLPLMEHSRLKIGAEYRPYAWEHLFKPWELLGGDPQTIGEWILGTELTLCLYNDFGVPLMHNVFENLLMEGEVRKGDALEGKFRGIPAIVCGAGPSLGDRLEELKQVQGRALIIGGGSALAPLSRAHIPIHFAAALDPDPPTERFYRQNHFETPLFYQNQVSHHLLKHHHGPKLCLGQSGSFVLEEWLTEKLALTPRDVGWNVSTFSTMIAAFLGCDPIYFVGLDLCVYDEASYVEGVEGMDERLNPISMKDRLGNVVFTRPDFLMSKRWLEEFAKKHPHLTFINATTRGLPLEGIQDGPLMVSTHSVDLCAKVHQKVMAAPMLDFSSLPEKFELLEESLKKTHAILQEYMDALERKQNTVLQECELEEQLFYLDHLMPLWKVWRNLLQTEDIVERMSDPPYEKKLQEVLFYQDVTEKFCHARSVSI